AQSESAKDEHNRIRQRKLVRQHGQDPDGCQQKDNNLSLVHESVAAVAGGDDPGSHKKYLIYRGRRLQLQLWPACGSLEAPRDVFPTNDKVPGAARSTCVPVS